VKLRRILAGAAVCASTLTPVAALAASSGSAYEYDGHDSGPPHGVIGTLSFYKRAGHPSVALSPYFSVCGEFNSNWMAVKANKFHLNHTWKNGFGVAITGQFNHAQTKISGRIRTWGGGCHTNTLSFSAHKTGTVQL
jgi:hypothetical protein